MKTDAQADKALTKWEAGNILVKAVDACGEAIDELESHPELRDAATAARKILSRAFYDNGLDKEMGFGI